MSSAPTTGGDAGLRRELGLRDLVFFHIAAVLSVRWISKAAALGPSSLVLWAGAWLLFFVPAAVVVLDFARRLPEQGGIYRWTQAAFGPFHGFLCAWCYVVSNLVYFPALLVTVADYLRGMLGWEPDPLFTQIVALGILWLVVALNVAGVRLARHVQTVGALALWVPCGLLLVLGAFALARDGSATRFANLVPAAGQLDSWRVWSDLCFAFAGVELLSTMAGEVRNPRRSVPRSIHIAGAAITGVYVLGTIALLVALPPGEISQISGILQGIARVLARVGLSWLTPCIALLLALGGVGAVGAWLAGSARLPFVVGLDHHLPSALGRVHPRFGTPHVALLWQGGVCTAVTLLSFAGSSPEEVYGKLNAATTLLYFLPFLYMFAAALRLAQRRAVALAASVGLLATAAAMLLAAIPSAGDQTPWTTTAWVVGGSITLSGVSLVFWFWPRRR